MLQEFIEYFCLFLAQDPTNSPLKFLLGLKQQSLFENL